MNQQWENLLKSLLLKWKNLGIPQSYIRNTWNTYKYVVLKTEVFLCVWANKYIL